MPADERLEQLQVLGAVPEHFGEPLNADDPVRHVDALDRAVVGFGGRHAAGAHARDGLVADLRPLSPVHQAFS